MGKSNRHDFIFLTALVLITSVGVINAVFNKQVVNEFENREINYFPKPDVSNIINQTFQNQFELALADQIAFSTQIKKIYFTSLANIKEPINLKLFPIQNEYSPMGDSLKYGEHIVYYPIPLEGDKIALKNRADNFNMLFSKHNNLNYYIYYIEREKDINLETQVKTGHYEFLKENINISSTSFNRFEIKNSNDFQSQFYKSDHHWNHIGSYNAYLDLVDMMVKDMENTVKRGEEVCFEQQYSGSKAAQAKVSTTFKETFCGYNFVLPKHETRINGEIMEYGNARKYLEGSKDDISYGSYYGSDDSLVHFNYYNQNRSNLLIIGESYDNAVIELIASHYNNTYSVDLRNLAPGEFSFDEFIIINKIEDVLFIGNMDFFKMDIFNIKQ